MTSLQLLIEAYGLYVLGGSLLLNFILMRSVVIQRYKFALEKMKIKIAFLELEYKKDENERMKLLQTELEDIKSKLKKVKEERNAIIFGIVLILLFNWLFSIRDKLANLSEKKEPIEKPKQEEKTEETAIDEFVKETELPKETSIDNLLEQLKEIERTRENIKLDTPSVSEPKKP